MSVDLGIADAVEALNEMPGVYPDGSCQGTIGEGGPHPYRGFVTVHWTDDDALALICSRFPETKVNGVNWGIVYPLDDAADACACEECAGGAA